MSDRFSMEIDIGGECPRSRLKELVGLLSLSGWYIEWEDGDAESGRDIIKLMEKRMNEDDIVTFTQHDGSPNLQDELLDLLQELKMPYIFRVSGDLCYDGDITWWCPGFTERKCMTSDVNAREVVVTRCWLQQWKNQDATLKDVLEHLEQCPPNLPPFKLVNEITPGSPT